jgi:hypothetical protein
MAHGGARAAREHGSHLPCERYEREVTHRIDATVKRVEVVLADPRLDRARTDSHPEQL